VEVSTVLVSFLFAVLPLTVPAGAQPFVEVGGGQVSPCPMESASLSECEL